MQNPYALMDRPQIRSETLDKIRQAIMTDQRPQSLEERIEALSEAQKAQLMRSVKMDQLSMQIQRVIDPYITYYEMLEQMYPKLGVTQRDMRAEVMESIDPASEMPDEIRLKREAERKAKADAHQKAINDVLDSYARPLVASDDIAEFKAETKLSANDMRLATIAADNRKKAKAEAQALAMKEAQSAGIAHAKATKPGSYKGRKPSYTAAQVSLIMQKFKEGDGVNKIARDVGLSKFSVSRITRDPDKVLESLRRWS